MTGTGSRYSVRSIKGNSGQDLGVVFRFDCIYQPGCMSLSRLVLVRSTGQHAACHEEVQAGADVGYVIDKRSSYIRAFPCSIQEGLVVAPACHF